MESPKMDSQKPPVYQWNGNERKIERGRPVIAFKRCLIVDLKKTNIISAIKRAK